MSHLKTRTIEKDIILRTYEVPLSNDGLSTALSAIADDLQDWDVTLIAVNICTDTEGDILLWRYVVEAVFEETRFWSPQYQQSPN